jgi:hypothetical protein
MSKIRLLSFDENGWEDYLYWLNEDKKFLAKINKLIKEILPNSIYWNWQTRRSKRRLFWLVVTTY